MKTMSIPTQCSAQSLTFNNMAYIVYSIQFNSMVQFFDYIQRKKDKRGKNKKKKINNNNKNKNRFEAKREKK